MQVVVIIFIAGVRGGTLGAVIGDIGITDDEMVHCGVCGKEIFCALGARAFRDFGAIQFSFPGVRQSSIHVSGNHQRIGRPPGLRLVAEE